MPQYIDADKLLEEVKRGGHALQEWSTLGVCCVIERQPTADVVLKSEVEELKRNLEQCENGYRQHIHLLQCKFADEKREIFEEIDKLAKEGGVIWTNYASAVLAELKKKYTEGKE